MLKKCKYIPRLETDRLVLRELTEADVADLRKWLGCDELYTYWGRDANKDEKNPELLLSLYLQKLPWIGCREMRMSEISVLTGWWKSAILRRKERFGTERWSPGIATIIYGG